MDRDVGLKALRETVVMAGLFLLGRGYLDFDEFV
jgi:hypothetical protein